MENEDVTRELGEEDPAIEENYREGWDSVATDEPEPLRESIRDWDMPGWTPTKTPSDDR